MTNSNNSKAKAQWHQGESDYYLIEALAMEAAGNTKEVDRLLGEAEFHASQAQLLLSEVPAPQPTEVD